MRMRVRLALYGAAVTALAMFGFGALLLAGARASAPADQDAALADLAARTVAELAATGVDLPPTPPLGAVDLASDTEPFVEVVTVDGTPLYSSGLYDRQPPRLPAAIIVEALDTGGSAATFTLPDGEAVRVHAVSWDSPESGTLVVAAGQLVRSVTEELAGLQAVIWVSAIITLLATTFVSWLVAGRALRPLGDLAETTDEIGTTGDLTRRLPEVTSRDELGRLTASFNSMLDRLQASRRELTDTLEAQRRFLADASHELRSPLTTIRSNAGFLLERDDVSEADRRETIADIAAEADRMADLTDHLLTLARAEAAPPPPPVPVDIGSLVTEVAGRARRTGVDISSQVEGPAIVQGDRGDIERLLWILIDNARKHGSEPVEIATTTADGRVEVAVADRGPGVAPEHRDRIFDRFYRADPARGGDGTGLGLAMARAITDAHRGRIRVEDREGGGARFVVTLPLA